MRPDRSPRNLGLHHRPGERGLSRRPPVIGKTHLSTGLAIKACHAGHRVEFDTAADWVTQLANAHHAGRSPEDLERLSRIPQPAINETGYLLFEPEAANLLFQLIVFRNKPLSEWGEVFGDDTVAAAMIDRLVHNAEIIAIKDDSYRLEDRDVCRTQPASKTE